MEYSQITDQIYIGTNFCCETHFDPELLKKGVTYDLSLEVERVDAPTGGAAYLWLPVPDMHAPTPQQFSMGVSFIKTAVQSGRKIYVHCKNGHGRSPVMVAAYLVTTGLSADDAVALIKQKRPEIHLQDVQMEGLRQFEQTYRSQNA
ncbi:MAG: hypothetical protein UY31_C0020G0009 [Candidatus Wolfebacteria bacterium GW2011_GWE1_48_7]|uniref:Uncharacterized protein n=3 Tax=Candidatus Wolfeibacteriota TaxID=1752735 RepID=A0A0G4ARL9_9BACT|nr:MAG: hypothetical protein UX70_C0001G0655 [Candidatus Wolfebacteria bacterium GW2011_GWB1_47_1]KKU34753.1 MAG: hypothetical protein UX49_C0036G0008 [Candidatus Wolfebacteria bacterium GW2011_GWC2_46_275]KKU42421.1 MAG: hypothetical protein UX58_C0002G0135 [Candidatus Wolfebacteria bacterium GW2011_GWB2_46_69]KKU54205.1 MAG: hypothetical protein UX76_C0004G0009 [Candidatus Wolfebacteria bacterium GW2011_GWC1_47_103]KKU58703.1 MAG: hypothetical protein UX83_C0013G0013 [Candidatus Wolfebacteria